MSRSDFIKPNVITGFVGEDLNHLPLMIPPNVSPSALNTDYYRQTIKRRAGYLRGDDRPQTHGGVSGRVASASFNGASNVLGFADALTMPGYWAISFSLYVNSVDSASVSGGEILRCGTPGADGFALTWQGTAYQLVFETSGGAKTLSVTANADEIVGIMIVYRVEDDGDDYYALYVNGTLDSETHATDTWSKPASVIPRFLNNGGSSHTMHVFIDELRLWDLNGVDNAAYATWLTGWTTDLNYKRQLTDSEAGDALLEYYWRLNQSEFDLANSRFNATVGAIKFYIPIVGLGFGSRNEEAAMSNALVSMPSDTTRPYSSGLLYHEGYWMQLGVQAWIYAAEAAALAVSSTRWSEFGNIYSHPITGQQWSWIRFRDRVIATHPQAGIYYYDPDAANGFYHLLPTTPSVVGVSAGDKGSGTGPGAGTYSFKFYYYNEDTGVHGLSNSTPVSVTMAGGNAIQFSGMGSILLNQRPLEGVTHLRVFRTANGGTTYYYVTDIAVSSSPSATYDDAAMNALDADLDQNATEQALRYDLAYYRPYRARSVFEHHGQIILLGVDENASYTAEDLQSNILYIGEPFATDLYNYDRRKECLPDVNDYLIGGVSVVGGALLARRYSLVAMFGESPDQYNFRFLSRAHGCVAGNTIAASDSAIYLLSDWGIIAVPLPLGAGVPKNVSIDRLKTVFDDFDPNTLDVACGVFWRAKSQYWVSFNTVSEGRITLIYDERTGAIAKYDLPIECYYIHQPDGTAPELWGTINGYRVRLDYGTRDGANIDDNVVAITGTVTASTSDSLTDNSKSWQHPLGYFQAAYKDVFSLLNGQNITVVDSDGNKQTRTILWNNGTTIWPTTPWDTTPTVGDTYYISGIDWHWKSTKFSPIGDPTDESQVQRLYLILDPNTRVYYPAIDIYIDGVDVDDENTLDPSLRLNDFLVNSRPREIEFKVSEYRPDQEIEIEGWTVGFEEARTRP